MHLTQIWIYPIKSCAGTRLTEGVLDERGIRFDRRWMLVDASGNAVTQREVPKLALVTPSVTSEALCVTAPGMPYLQLPHSSSTPKRVTIFGQQVDAVSLPQAQEWFHTYTGKEVELVYMPDSSPRPMLPEFGKRNLTFVDGNPLHIVGEASVAELNTRLRDPIDLAHFRPNLVFSGGEPHAEDNWQRVRIGDVSFSVYEACQRCMVVNINPSTATFSKEPLATLARYRRVNGQVVFGQNLNHLQTGVIRVGSSLIPFPSISERDERKGY